MQQPKVSVIIPVYKVSKHYLKDCIESVSGQTFKNLEIIIIDDGSPKECGVFLDKYANNDARINVFHRKNEGVSSARNYGLNVATGKYIMFVDADDWLEYTAVEDAVRKINEYDCDVVGWNHFYNGNEEYKREAIYPSPISYEGDKILNLMYDMITPEFDKRYRQVSLGAVRGVWGKLYKSSIIKENRIRFAEELSIGEDAFFNINYLKNIKKATFYNNYLNHYRVNEESANRRYREDILDIRIALLNRYYNFFSELGRIEDIRFTTCYVEEVLSCVVNCMRKYVCHCDNKNKINEKIQYIKYILNKEEIIVINSMLYERGFFRFYEKILITLIRNKNALLLYIIGKSVSKLKKNK